ncbi:MAG: helix-turn-helix domain-containing protein [Candidatus Omnitrophica bacterium]|nr:helix-turn-helix domain-containing protein [Candidatus Omnitrophota bacterium]
MLLQALTPEQRACVILKNIEGMRYEEIARTLGIGMNTVRSRLKRAREKMLSMRNEVMANAL